MQIFRNADDIRYRRVTPTEAASEKCHRCKRGTVNHAVMAGGEVSYYACARHGVEEAKAFGATPATSVDTPAPKAASKAPEPPKDDGWANYKRVALHTYRCTACKQQWAENEDQDGEGPRCPRCGVGGVRDGDVAGYADVSSTSGKEGQVAGYITVLFFKPPAQRGADTLVLRGYEAPYGVKKESKR